MGWLPRPTRERVPVLYPLPGWMSLSREEPGGPSALVMGRRCKQCPLCPSRLVSLRLLFLLWGRRPCEVPVTVSLRMSPSLLQSWNNVLLNLPSEESPGLVLPLAPPDCLSERVRAGTIQDGFGAVHTVSSVDVP